MITVRIGSEEHDLERVLESPADYARALELARGLGGYAECGCNMASPRPKLVIRAHGMIFILARWPDDPRPHLGGCPFLDRYNRLKGTTTKRDPFQFTGGIHDMRLDVALKVAAGGQKTPTRRPSTAAARTQRRAAPLLAFLQYAWQSAGLHTWPGYGRRGWNACWVRLVGEMAECNINGRPGSEVLHVMERWDEARKADLAAELEAFHNGASISKDSYQRRLIIGEIDVLRPSPHGGQLKLRQARHWYFLSNELYEQFQQKYKIALTGIGREDLRCVVVLAFEKSRQGYLNVMDAAAMLANGQFIPCDSSYEAAMSDRLVAENRAFEKPLRHIDNAPVHPDFRLTDTVPETVIEVLGLAGNPEYDQRMAEKRAYYRENGLPLVEWVPTTESLAAVQLPAPVPGRPTRAAGA
ncbi:DUF1173 family protein [Cupriavidus pinatubonensis]|uniref:DUF1173 domain-containing protein n=1 Tax=Cupriavidus pinatubonensis TaxID=248026 RepID=A0ABN7Y136_9BURK|nr:DUF1173 family protein [Cupriavidus pinatubonensis]CAG9165645.1 hypothetical protein LMG23994_00768 [Cupriavidus pinatubonensis]